MHLPKPKTADWSIACISVALLGASAVIGPNTTYNLQLWLFWGGIAGLGGLLIWLVVLWFWNLAQGAETKEPPGIDNRGGIFIGRNNRGNQTIINNTDPSGQETMQGMLTGGDSYCFFGLYFFDVDKNIAKNIAVVRQGKYSLYDVRMRILDMDTKEEKNLYIGEISGGGTSRSISIPGAWNLKDCICYRIFFSARNGLWHQDLLLRKSVKESYWPAATRVVHGDGSIRHENVDSKYVAEFGPPVWSA
jgi:hypothetical protein